MDIPHIIVGLFLIAMGFLVRKFPDLIAGYNTMPKEEKKNVDMDGLSKAMRNGMVAMGLTIIIGYHLFAWLGLQLLANLIIMIAIFGGITILMVVIQKFDGNKKRKGKWLGVIIMAIITILLAISFAYELNPTKVEIKGNIMRFTGSYGLTLQISDIKSVELIESIGSLRRTNGLNIGHVNKGNFDVTTLGKCRLFVHSNTPPYILVRRHNADPIIINYRNKADTEQIYQTLRELCPTEDIESK